MLQDFGRGLRDGSTEAAQDALYSADIVVLDDLGAEKATEYATAQIYEIVSRRYNAGLPIMVSSNYAPEELATHGKGDYKRIVSRLRGMCTVVALGGEDWR